MQGTMLFEITLYISFVSSTFHRPEVADTMLHAVSLIAAIHDPIFPRDRIFQVKVVDRESAVAERATADHIRRRYVRGSSGL